MRLVNFHSWLRMAFSRLIKCVWCWRSDLMIYFLILSVSNFGRRYDQLSEIVLWMHLWLWYCRSLTRCYDRLLLTIILFYIEFLSHQLVINTSSCVFLLAVAHYLSRGILIIVISYAISIGIVWLFSLMFFSWLKNIVLLVMLQLRWFWLRVIDLFEGWSTLIVLMIIFIRRWLIVVGMGRALSIKIIAWAVRSTFVRGYNFNKRWWFLLLFIILLAIWQLMLMMLLLFHFKLKMLLIYYYLYVRFILFSIINFK